MAREKGLLPISANFEYRIASPSDPRVRVDCKADLIDSLTYSIYAYVGMIVSVNADGANNGVYRLTALPSTTETNWERLGSGAVALSATIKDWTPLTVYTKDEVVYDSISNKLYRVTANHTSTADITDDIFDTLLDAIADEVYNNSNPSVIAVGGLPIGTTFDSMKISEVFDAMFYPELFGSLSNPSLAFTSSVTGVKEVGETIPSIVFSSTFSQGGITPQYLSLSPSRSGLPNLYTYTGIGLNNKAITDLSDVNSITDYVVLIGTQNWTSRISYDAGVQPKGSKGTNFNTPLVAGNTSTVTRSITGVYPCFSSVVTIDTLTKLALQAHGAVLTVTMLEEDGVNKQKIEIPLVYGTISKMEQFNTLSGTWDEIDKLTFTVSATTRNIHGSVIDYNTIAHNGSNIGTRQLRFTF